MENKCFLDKKICEKCQRNSSSGTGTEQWIINIWKKGYVLCKEEECPYELEQIVSNNKEMKERKIIKHIIGNGLTGK